MIKHATAENRPNVVGLQERRLDRTILRFLLFERGREQYRQIPVEVTDRTLSEEKRLRYGVSPRRSGVAREQMSLRFFHF
jgi:hypothetical protein